MKQTAMQELKWFISDGLNNFDESVKVSEIWDKVEELVEQEKQQIIDSFNQGFREGETETMVVDTQKDVAEYDDAINYYNETYKK